MTTKLAAPLLPSTLWVLVAGGGRRALVCRSAVALPHDKVPFVA